MRRRANNGFTLVEVIVTAVIVAVLAGVAIPNYIGYVNQTRQDAVNGLAETAAAAANSYWRKTGGTTPPNVASLGLTYDATKYTVTISSPNITVTLTGSNPSITKTVSFQ